MCVIRVVINRVFSLSVTKETDPRGTEVKLHFPEKNKKNVNHYSLEFLLSHITKKKRKHFCCRVSKRKPSLTTAAESELNAHALNKL